MLDKLTSSKPFSTNRMTTRLMFASFVGSRGKLQSRYGAARDGEKAAPAAVSRLGPVSYSCELLFLGKRSGHLLLNRLHPNRPSKHYNGKWALNLPEAAGNRLSIILPGPRFSLLWSQIC